MIDVKKLSRTRPEGHLNHWPIGDYLGYVGLIQAAEERDEADPVDRVPLAAKELGLHSAHWLVRYVLFRVYDKFPIDNGRWYAVDARSYFKNATLPDLADEEVTAWAKGRIESQDQC